MKLFKLFILLSFFFLNAAFSQKVIKHSVKSGESVYSIAKKYDITEKELYENNPKLKGKVLGLKTLVQIPNKKYKEVEKKDKNSKDKNVKDKNFKDKKIEEIVNEDINATISHLVSAKETLYSISKNYNVSMESICELNPELKTEKLKTGSRIKLPIPENAQISEQDSKKKKSKSADVIKVTEVEVIKSNVDIVHQVLPKETLYGISKKFGVTVNEIKELNPTIANGLPIGFMLVIKKGDEQIIPDNEIVTNTEDSDSIAISSEDDGAEDVAPLSSDNLSRADHLIEKASENIGTRYRSGGTTTSGFDCSGFMCYTFNTIDLQLPRSSREMAGFGKKIKKSKAQKGDLIFFATMGRHRISHVGMVTEVNDDEIKFIHSSTSSGVMISSTKENYYAKSFVQVNRVLQN